MFNNPLLVFTQRLLLAMRRNAENSSQVHGISGCAKDPFAVSATGKDNILALGDTANVLSHQDGLLAKVQVYNGVSVDDFKGNSPIESLSHESVLDGEIWWPWGSEIKGNQVDFQGGTGDLEHFLGSRLDRDYIVAFDDIIRRILQGEPVVRHSSKRPFLIVAYNAIVLLRIIKDQRKPSVLPNWLLLGRLRGCLLNGAFLHTHEMTS